jgi:hypothetical protein
MLLIGKGMKSALLTRVESQREGVQYLAKKQPGQESSTSQHMIMIRTCRCYVLVCPCSFIRLLPSPGLC